MVEALIRKTFFHFLASPASMLPSASRPVVFWGDAQASTLQKWNHPRHTPEAYALPPWPVTLAVMICRLQGVLESLVDGSAILQLSGGVSYELLVPAFVEARLGDAVGTTVTFHTVHYLEGSATGSNLTPRLAGFTSVEDRAFFKIFTSVKGIGPRKAMRAMSISTSQIAAAIVDRDFKLLQSMPEIGKRTAETMVAELSGKVDHFATEAALAGLGSGGEAEDEPTGAVRGIAREALEVLLQLGESRMQALTWIEEVVRKQPEIESSDALIAEIFRLKTSS
jgi:Holliday junction DNA helicase RuvA